MIIYLFAVGYDVAIYRADLGLLYSEVIITKYKNDPISS